MDVAQWADTANDAIHGATEVANLVGIRLEDSRERLWHASIARKTVPAKNHSNGGLKLNYLVARREYALSPWVGLVERTVDLGRGQESYHALRLADYVSILAITSDNEVVLVRQYRPAIDRMTLELPGGLLEPGEDPSDCAARELAEETGYSPIGPLKLLGTLSVDACRLENRMWCYLARPVYPAADFRAEAGVEHSRVSLSEFRRMIVDGRFDHAPHMAIAALGILTGEL